MKNKIQRLLSRKTTSINFIPEIDGFRFYAIFTVLIYHLNTHLSRLIADEVGGDYYSGDFLYNVAHEGGIGVNVFFGISGFILALPFAAHQLAGTRKVALGSYYIRRLTRLEPPYIVSLIIFFLVHIYFLGEKFSELFPSLIASVLYIHNILFDRWSDINPVAWSLEVEVQFYLLAPLLASVFKIRNSLWRRIIIVMVILGSIANYNFNYEWIQSVHLRKSLLMNLHHFFIGFLFADFYLTDWKGLLKSKSYGFDLAGILAMTAMLIFNDPFVLTHDIVFAICLFLSFTAIFKGKLINIFYTNSWIVIIGGMCYSIYLLHYAFLAFLAGYTKILFIPPLGYGLNLLIQVLVTIPIVLIVSSVYFILIERPCMDKDWPVKLKHKVISFFPSSTQ